MTRNVVLENNSTVLIKFLMMSNLRIETMLVRHKENVNNHVMIKYTTQGKYRTIIVNLYGHWFVLILEKYLSLKYLPHFITE